MNSMKKFPDFFKMGKIRVEYGASYAENASKNEKIGAVACRFDPARKRFPRGKRIRCTRKPGIAESSFDRGDNLTAHAPERAVHYYPHIRFTLPICESLLSHDNLSCENGDTPLSQIFSFYYISADKRYVFPRPS